jgi:hypothetical protein
LDAPELIIGKNGKATLKTGSFALEADVPASGLSRTNFQDGLFFETRPCVLGKTAESISVAKKRHFNQSKDGSVLSVLMRNAIPFGTEPEIVREIAVSEGLLRHRLELKLRNSFEMEFLDAASFSVGGPLARIAVMRAPAKASLPELDWLDFASFDELELAVPPLAILLESASGSLLEIGFGEDLWRWAAATRHCGSCRFALRKEKGVLRFDCEIFKLNPETPPPKGWPWRLDMWVAWREATPKKPGRRKLKASFDLAAEEWPEQARCVIGGELSDLPCLSSSIVMNKLRNWLRSQLASLEPGDVIGVLNAEPSFCERPSHQDRPKLDSLPHWGMGALLDFADWARRQLESNGAKLVVMPKASSKAVPLPSLAALR